MNENLKNKNTCTACSACSFVCNHDAITMMENKDGFLFPVINKNLCVNCGFCSKICNKAKDTNSINIRNAIAFQSSDDALLFNASSGGAVPTIAQIVIEFGGLYVATKYDPAYKKAYWDFISSKEDIKNTSGSKYFQIPLSKDIIGKIIAELRFRRVLFVGTPCQVDAIKKLTPTSLSASLITIDLVCGGVQSYKIEKLYLESLEKKSAHKVISRKFRGKDYGWRRKYLSVIEYDDGNRQLLLGSQDLFQRTFSNGSYLRESCYNCEFTGRNRVGDITVGDCWGIEKEKNVSFRQEKGISLVAFNTEKSFWLREHLKIKGVSSAINENVLAENKPLNRQRKRPRIRNVSYKMIDFFPISCATNIVCYKYFIKKIMRRG